jgi:hypothetical protein
MAVFTALVGYGRSNSALAGAVEDDDAVPTDAGFAAC